MFPASETYFLEHFSRDKVGDGGGKWGEDEKTRNVVLDFILSFKARVVTDSPNLNFQLQEYGNYVIKSCHSPLFPQISSVTWPYPVKIHPDSKQHHTFPLKMCGQWRVFEWVLTRSQSEHALKTPSEAESTLGFHHPSIILLKGRTRFYCIFVFILFL